MKLCGRVLDLNKFIRAQLVLCLYFEHWGFNDGSTPPFWRMSEKDLAGEVDTGVVNHDRVESAIPMGCEA